MKISPQIDKRVERLPDHVFQKGEKVYVFAEDGNEYFDIYEAEITGITDDGYEVHYPEYPDDDETAIAERILPQTTKNNAEYQRQETIRLQKDKQQNNSSEASSESDGDFGESSSDDEPKKPQKQKKERVKKEKPPKKERVKKEKAPRPKRQPKPKKEKKEAKQKKRRDNDFVFIREAFQNGARNANEFVSYLETKYADKEFHMDQLARKFEDYVSQHQEGEVSDYQEDYYAEDNLNEPEEMPTFNEETIRIYKDIEETLPEADELILPRWITFNDPNAIMSINFTPSADDEDEQLCNAFLYTTEDGTKYLILNGQKLKLQGEELLYDDYYYEKHPTRVDGLTPVSQAAYTSVYKKKGFYKILKKPADVEQMEATLKKPKKNKEAAITTPSETQTKSSYSSRSRKEKWDAKTLEEYSD